MQGSRFPRYVNKPWHILMVESDEALIIVVFFMMGLFGSSWFLLGCVLGPLVYSRFKKGYPRGFLKHTLYFLGLASFKNYPSFFERDFRE